MVKAHKLPKVQTSCIQTIHVGLHLQRVYPPHLFINY